MKNLFKISLILCLTILIYSCKKDKPDPEPTPETPESTATINGAEFKATTNNAVTVTDSTSDGYLLSFSDGSTTVALNTKDKTSGEYSVCARCKTTGMDSVAASVTVNGTTYNGTSGTVTISVSSDGKVSGTYSFDAVSTSNVSISIKNGSFSDVQVSQVTFEEQLKSLLVSKNWIITGYSDSKFGNSIGSEICKGMVAEASADTSQAACEYCSEYYLWKTYTARFTSTGMNGTFINENRKGSNSGNCNIQYTATTKTDEYVSQFVINSNDKTIKVNFGNIFNRVDSANDELVNNMTYKVKSMSAAKIELTGTATAGANSITRTVVLE